MALWLPMAPAWGDADPSADAGHSASGGPTAHPSTGGASPQHDKDLPSRVREAGDPRSSTKTKPRRTKGVSQESAPTGNAADGAADAKAGAVGTGTGTAPDASDTDTSMPDVGTSTTSPNGSSPRVDLSTVRRKPKATDTDQSKPATPPKAVPSGARSKVTPANVSLSATATTAKPAVLSPVSPTAVVPDVSSSRQAETPVARTIESASATTSEPSTVIKAAAAGATTTTTTARPTLVNVVGSFVFNLLGAAMLAFAGPPVAPRGSTVTVKVSSLTMPDTGQKVQADWYFPEDADSTTRIIYFQHGFMAVAPMYSYTLAALAQNTNSIVVAPTLSSNAFDPNAQWIGGSADQQAVADLFAGDRAALTESASAAAGHQVTLPTSFVLVAHSLGGALVTSAAGRMVDNGAIANLQGVVLMDSVDLNNAVPNALQKLTGANYRPIYDISSEPYVWNRNGLVGQELEAARPGQFNGVMLTGGRHIDAMVGANPILQFAEYAVAGFSQPQNVEAEKTLAAGWINDMFAGTHTGIYGSPQQAIEIPTSAGTATAVALPFVSNHPIQAMPWDGLMQLFLNAVMQSAVYEPMGQTSAAAL